MTLDHVESTNPAKYESNDSSKLYDVSNRELCCLERGGGEG